MINILKSINKNEKRFIVIVIAFVIIVTSIPYIFGLIRTPDGSFYTGIHALTPGDTNVYYSYIEQVKQGEIIFRDLYTSEIQDAPLINPFWFIIGLFGKITHLPTWLTLQISRLVLAAVFVMVAYIFISYIFIEKSKRKLALIILLFSSGFGGALAPFLEQLKYYSDGYYHWPMDLWVPESVTFLSLFHLPHIIFSSILSLVVFLFALLSFETDKFRYSILSGVAALFWFSFHPFHFFTLVVVLSVYLFIHGISTKKFPTSFLKHALIIILMSLPAVIYQYAIIAGDSVISGRAEQNLLLTPSWWLVVVSYGFVGILALLGVVRVLKQQDRKWFFIAIWFVVQTLLLYAPLSFQRRLSQNLHFPMALLALFALGYIVKRYKDINLIKYVSSNKIILGTLFVLFFSFSNIYALANDILLYRNMSYPFFYLSSDYKDAFRWLKDNAQKEDSVLSEWIDGNFIPGYSGRTVYIGHDVETVDFEYKEKQVEWFFQNNLDLEEKKEFLTTAGLDFIFFSGRSAELGDFDPQNKKFLLPEFISEEIKIYRVIQ
ncbi:MAG: hypothetical protein WCW66_05520 [Patescibacteria group bacterium]